MQIVIASVFVKFEFQDGGTCLGHSYNVADSNYDTHLIILSESV